MTTTQRPAKPYKEFPLFAHPNGQWCKKIRGKAWYFGMWNEHEAALQKYLDEVDEIRAGRDPRRQRRALSHDAVAVADMCNLFLEAMDARRAAGQISPRHFADYRHTCKVLVDYFGRYVCASTLKAADFAGLRQSFPSTWGPTKTGNEIRRMKAAFRWAAESETIPALPNFGPEFKQPSKAVIRRVKQDRQSRHGTLDFTAEELRGILNGSAGSLRASVLLGINAGFGAADCGRLRVNNVDFETGWYDLPRRKTAIPRRFLVWTETRAAIRDAMAQRPVAKNQDDDELCFLTGYGNPVWREHASGSISDSVGRAFLTKCRQLELHKPGRSFYSLRRTYETVAGNTKDQAAVNFAMGHSDESMAAVYRQGIDDQRLIDVAEHVRQWLWTRKCEACGEKQFFVADEWTCDSCGAEQSVD
ncbi:MAG: tyrosine-type recombinase/integrase, partial [Fuerstiella sp.]